MKNQQDVGTTPVQIAQGFFAHSAVGNVIAVKRDTPVLMKQFNAFGSTKLKTCSPAQLLMS